MLFCILLYCGMLCCIVLLLCFNVLHVTLLRMYMCVHIHISVYPYVCMYVCLYVCMHACMHVCVCVYMYACASTDAHARIYQCPQWSRTCLSFRLCIQSWGAFGMTSGEFEAASRLGPPVPCSCFYTKICDQHHPRCTRKVRSRVNAVQGYVSFLSL